MAPSITTVKATLAYPLFAAEFDPENDERLVVGGGGGEGRSGVGNKITILKVWKRDISPIAELELSRDEDSVTSLAVPWSRPDGTVIAIFAGVNSSQKAKRNDHFRRFVVKLDESSKGDAEWSREPSLSLFSHNTGPKREIYQRITRLSPVREGPPKEGGGYSANPRMCAAASSFGPEGEIVFAQTLQPETLLGRIILGKGVEAADIDIIEAAPQKFLAVYCTDHDMFIYGPSLNRKETDKTAPRHLYTSVPRPKGTRSTFRAVRFLTPSLILLLCNLPARSGAQLLVLKVEGPNQNATVVMQKQLHSKIKAGMGVDVAILSDRYDDLEGGDKQFVIAVAGQDISIEILTLEYSPSRGGLKAFRPYTILKNVHPVQMTKLAFSRFIPPGLAVDVSRHPKPPRLRLASVSMGNTVAVYTLPLFPVPYALKSKSAVTAPNSHQRYILTAPSRTSQETKQALSIIFSLVIITIAAIVIQGLLELRGGSPPVLHVADRIPVGLRSYLEKPGQQRPWESIVSDMKTEGEVLKDRIQDLLHQHHPQTGKAIIMRDTDTDIVADVVHDPEKVTGTENLRKWEELPEEEKAGWKRKLVNAGKWAYDEGEGVLKSVLWAQVGGVVEGVVRGG